MRTLRESDRTFHFHAHMQHRVSFEIGTWREPVADGERMKRLFFQRLACSLARRARPRSGGDGDPNRPEALKACPTWTAENEDSSVSRIGPPKMKTQACPELDRRK
jgi:hypothetical protein